MWKTIKTVFMQDTGAWLTSCLLVHCVGQVDITASRPHLLWHKPTLSTFTWNLTISCTPVLINQLSCLDSMYSTNNPFIPNLPQLQLFCLCSLLHLLRRKCIKLVSLCTYRTLSKLQGIKPSIRLCYHGYLLIKSTLRWCTFTTLETFFFDGQP